MAGGIGARTWAMGAIVGGKYRLEAQIGAGGFGGVFRGTRVADRLPVAIKLLTRAAMLRGDATARFRREAELAMKLEHESTIRVLDSGDAGNGIPFIAFELLEGRSLDAALAEGPLDEARAFEVTMALLGSLEEAHGLGIVHRDVKPANVFLCSKPEGLVKLLDFGVAKSTVSGGLELTGDGIMVGTPAYMAPEQIAAKDISAPADLYAVALVLAEMVSGRPVYQGAPIVLCMEKMRGVPVPFDDRVRASRFFEVIERATRNHPSTRYPSAAQMRAALAPLRPTQAVPALSEPPPRPHRAPMASRPSGGTEVMAIPTPPPDPRAQAHWGATQGAAPGHGADAFLVTAPVPTPRMVPAGGWPAPVAPQPLAPAPRRHGITIALVVVGLIVVAVSFWLAGRGLRLF